MKPYTRVLLTFYRRCSGRPAATLADIPAEQLAFLSAMEYTDLLRPILVEALRDGASVNSLADYYGVARPTVRWYRDKFCPARRGA